MHFGQLSFPGTGPENLNTVRHAALALVPQLGVLRIGSALALCCNVHF